MRRRQRHRERHREGQRERDLRQMDLEAGVFNAVVFVVPQSQTESLEEVRVAKLEVPVT